MTAGQIIAEDLDAILDRRPAIWTRLQGASLLLTGGTGWFGRWLLEAIAHANRRLDCDIRVTVLSRNPHAFRRAVPHLGDNPAFQWLHGDIRDFTLPERRISHVIHAATTSAHETFHGETPLAKFDTLVEGTRHLLDQIRHHEIEHLLFTSSGVAYGPLAEGRDAFREDDLAAPPTTDNAAALGHAKRAAEFLCAHYAKTCGWHASIARCFAFIGPFMPLDLHYAAGNFLRQKLDGEPVVVRGTGLPMRSYLYAADLVVWLLELLLRAGEPRVFNVGSDAPVSIRELAELIAASGESRVPVECLGQADATAGNPAHDRYLPNIERARNELGLAPWTELPEAVDRTLRHLCQFSPCAKQTAVAHA